jgi:hypothetical protein
MIMIATLHIINLDTIFPFVSSFQVTFLILLAVQSTAQRPLTSISTFHNTTSLSHFHMFAVVRS